MRGWSDPSALGVFVIAVALLLAAGTSGALRLPPLNVYGPLSPSGIKVTAVLGVLCLVVAGGIALVGVIDPSPQPPASPQPSTEVPSVTTPPSTGTTTSPPPPTTSSRSSATSTGGSPPSTGNTGSPSAALRKLAADRVSLGTSEGFDFDAGETAFAGDGADIVVDSTSISRVSDTALTLSGRTDTEPGGCPAESHISRVSRGGTPSGESVCVSTTSGNLAVFRLLGSSSSSEVVLDYVLWGSQ